MRRLSTTALQAVRRTVDDTPSLLARTAEAAPTEDDAGGRAPWLFLHRPDGWEDELAALEASAAARSHEAAGAAEERVAQRRLRAVEEELRRAHAQVAEARRSAASLVELEAALADERRRRAEVEGELESLRGRVAAIERERDAAHRRASASDKALAEARAAAVAGAPDGGADLDAARSALAAARRALEGAAASVGDVAAALEVRPPEVPRRPAAGDDRRRYDRLPAPLPPGMLDDDPAAADHLVRLPSAVLLVDGYNLSLRRWGGLPLVEQRARLVDALNGLAARTGVDVEVVFDGQDAAGGGLRSSGGRRRAVRVTFSPEAVEADDVLLELVSRTPPSRPVVVATDDRRVQREAAARGANVVGSAGLFEVLGLGR